MGSRTRWWAAGLAAAGLMALPATPTAQGTTGGTASQSYGQSSTENKSPRYHLDQAKRVLDELSRSSDVAGSQTSPTTTGSGTTGSGTTGSGTTGSGTTGSGTTGSGTTSSQSGSTMSGATDTASIVSELRRHFTQLEQAYERSRRDTSTSGTTSGAAGTTGSGTTGAGTTGSGTIGSEAQSSDTGESWMTHYSRLNQVLDRINVPKTSTATGTSGSMSGAGTSGSTSGTGSGTAGSGTTGGGTTGSGTTGSASTSGSMSQSGSSSIDPSTMSRLREFRMHIDNFHAAAMAEGSRR